MKTILIITGVFVLLFLLGWLGLQIQPASFPAYPEASQAIETVPLPSGLPAPVERYYRLIYGEKIPVIKTVVITGRGAIRPFFNIPLPARFVFVHNAGKDYRHYIEATFFGMPLMKVNERYVDGISLFELPVATYENDASINQGAILGLWAEAGWFPSIWVTDPRVRWEPVDEKTAVLYVPFGDKEENFIVRFNAKTGLIDSLEAMRYRDAGPDARKILWITQNLEGKNIEGTKISAIGAATWLDQGKPWATFILENVTYNVDVSEYIRKKGY